MIEAILDDSVEARSASNGPPFASAMNYPAEVARRDAAAEIWRLMGDAERAPYNGQIEAFIAAEGVFDLKSEAALQSKNLYLLRNEVAKQISTTNPLKLLVVEELHFSSALVELLENIENSEHIRELAP